MRDCPISLCSFFFGLVWYGLLLNGRRVSSVFYDGVPITMATWWLLVLVVIKMLLILLLLKLLLEPCIAMVLGFVGGKEE